MGGGGLESRCVGRAYGADEEGARSNNPQDSKESFRILGHSWLVRKVR